MNPNISDDLLWTAFQYALDELPEPAARAFESRLEREQEVREALAEAVAWYETVRASEEFVSVPLAQSPALPLPPSVVSEDFCSAPVSAIVPAVQQYNWRAAVGWVALGAAACLALVFAAQRIHPIAENGGREAVAAQAESDARLLAALSVAPLPDDASPLIAPLHEQAVATEHEENLESAPAAELDVAAPDWLLAAVAESSEFGGNE